MQTALNLYCIPYTGISEGRKIICTLLFLGYSLIYIKIVFSNQTEKGNVVISRYASDIIFK